MLSKYDYYLDLYIAYGNICISSEKMSILRKSGSARKPANVWESANPSFALIGTQHFIPSLFQWEQFLFADDFEISFKTFWVASSVYWIYWWAKSLKIIIWEISMLECWVTDLRWSRNWKGKKCLPFHCGDSSK